jgi:DNA-binding NtrC family response regulator
VSDDDFDDLEQGGTVQQRPRGFSPAGAFTLTVVAGPDTGAAFALDASQPGPLLLGQGPACHVRLTDPQVSRRHAAIDLADGLVRVRDLRSTNGTYVHGAHVMDAYVAVGQQIRVGATQLELAARLEGGADPPPKRTSFGKVFGASTEMRRLYPILDRLAQSDVPVVIEGETGTGKELVAEAIHDSGRRAAGPYVVFDCTAVPPSLVESELFGHEKGAFTGAVSARRGIFERAHGGTLLIDEIGDLDLSLQPKLLRALERGEFRRVGGDGYVRVDVRVLAATRRDLDREVQSGRFRDDLFHRLAVGRVELPPLRERRGDIVLLAQRFWSELGGPTPIPFELLDRWDDEPWHGNVRELRNAVARAVTLGDLEPLRGDPASHDAPDEGVIARVISEGHPFPVARLKVLEAFERRYTEHVLEQHGGNVRKAAAASGIGRRYFQMIRERLKR